jgi:hypothetical protein
MKQAGNQEPGVVTLVTRTIDDAKRWGRAEVAYYKSLAGERGVDAGIGVGLGVVALAVAQAALIALLVGLILTLTPELGAGISTLIVVAGALLIVAILGLMALGRLRRAGRPIGKDGE